MSLCCVLTISSLYLVFLNKVSSDRNTLRFLARAFRLAGGARALHIVNLLLKVM